ncbi:MAG: hypothetical protein AB8D52_05125 [Gammaproteobacteria bacterium]
MADDKSNSNLENPVLDHPDIKGWVAIRNDETQSVSSDPAAEKLGEVLIYFNEISGLIGETFGLERPDEIHIVCDELTAVCLPGVKETVGIIFDQDTKPDQFLAKYKTASS